MKVEDKFAKIVVPNSCAEYLFLPVNVLIPENIFD
jgi:hypothetical protein